MSTAFDSKASKFNKYTMNTISTATTKTTASTTTTTTTTTSATTSTNNSIATINAKTTQIPSYQTTSNYNRLHKPLAEQFNKADEVPQQNQYYNPHHHHHHHHHDHNHSHEYHHQHHYHKQQQQQQSHLPLPVAINYNASSNFNIPTTQTNISTVANNGAFGGSGGSSSASSSSPQSPPSTQFHLHHINEPNVVADISKQNKKSAASSASASTNASVSCSSSSPFVQRKYNNGCSSYKHGESPKKDSSMFGSIGQSIIRNLTTSPFSQKKHGVGTTMTQQQQKIDAHWRMPPTNTQDVAVAYDIFDSSAPRTLATATSKIAKQQQSPIFGRSRFQSTTSAVTAQQQLIPKNSKIETNTTNTQQRVQGNQSPIVLQRFYHQQNQLREREMERQQQQPHHHHLSFQQHSDVTTTNPFLSSYVQPPSHLSHIPIASIASSASSQSSSTQSSNNSQNASAYESSNSYHQHQQQPRSLSPQTTVTAAFGLASDEVAATGLRSLQYQPLPQQFLPLKNSLRHTASLSQQRTPPASTTPEEEYSNAFAAGIAGVCGGSGKHGKLSNRRELQAAATSSNLSGSSSGIGSGSGIGASKENSFKEHHATAMTSNGTDSSKTSRSGLPFYRTISAGGSNSTSPTDASPKRVSNFLHNDSCCPPATSSTPTLFKRFGVGAGSASSSAGHHVLAGIDRRHRSPDPPPRYNRGQSPLLLRKNLLELSGGQPPGSPLLQHRRYVTASPPLPPPRRGSESVPGSPQHFRTRIHYTPEPQRRIYRTIDQ